MKIWWSPCKNANARILIHSNTDVWLSKYFYQTRSLGFTFVIVPFQAGGDPMGLSGQSGCHREKKINPKSWTVPLLTKLFERTGCTLGRRCSEWRLFGHQEVEGTHQFPSLFSPKPVKRKPRPENRVWSWGTFTSRRNQWSPAKSPAGGIYDHELVEKTIQIIPHRFSIPGFRNWRKQLHSECLIKNPHQYTNRKYYL